MNTNPQKDESFNPDFYNIPKSRWDYKLLSRLNLEPITNELDFCKWWRRVAAVVMLGVVALYFAVCFVAAPLMMLAGWNIEGASVLSFIFWFTGVFVWTMLIVLSFSFMIVGSGVWVSNFMNKRKNHETKPGLIKQKYRSWKEKHCPKAKVVDE